MHIEVATSRSQSSKDKGDLLENLAAELLRTQSYDVETEVRRTASELDLLCRHSVSNRQIYVECKAHRENLSANVLKNLLGTVTFADYEEGWLISTGPLGKDAKGFQVEWEEKPQPQRQKLSIYTPDRVLKALIAAKVVSQPPATTPAMKAGGSVSTGNWTLLVSEYGRFWAQTVLVSGAPTGVQVFDAKTAESVSDLTLLRRLAATDSTLSTLDFEYGVTQGKVESEQTDQAREAEVVQVQFGESWSDYRPSRPEDFVGRKPAQDLILKFLEDVRSGNSSTRVFAVTGDSGMGKSSLIAKLRDRTRNIRNRNKFFVYAVDVRAATGPSYIARSLLECLRSAADSNFIEFDRGAIQVSNHSQPLASESIKQALDVARSKGRVLCLVFDQFEELYSKSDLFPIFEEAQRLFLSAVSAENSLVLGFAWRTDSTVQQDHPAYFLWHRLSDHRLEVPIGPFSHTEASAAITVFEKELGQQLLPGIRRQVVENSRGYPWLLKKLCIHLYDRLADGKSQAKFVDTLDVGTLFSSDLKQLSQPELSCLRLIAAQAPADWHEVLETAGPEVLRGLQDKRLIVRSGDRLNLYWDLFREFVLSGTPPSVPFTYVPSSPSIGAFLDVAAELTPVGEASFEDISARVDLSPGTVQNIVHDLVMFGVARESGTRPSLSQEMESSDREDVLARLREVLRRHALYLALLPLDEDVQIELSELITTLQQTNPTAHHRSQTWKLYAERMASWLCATGLLQPAANGWCVRDAGHPVEDVGLRRGGGRGRVHRKPFQGEAPPDRVVAALSWIEASGSRTKAEVKEQGFRNAVGVLVRFRLVQLNAKRSFEPTARDETTPLARVWGAARADPTIAIVRRALAENSSLSGSALGQLLAEELCEQWSPASRTRTGNGLRRWASWLLAEGETGAGPPSIPESARGKPKPDHGQGKLFE